MPIVLSTDSIMWLILQDTVQKAFVVEANLQLQDCIVKFSSHSFVVTNLGICDVQFGKLGCNGFLAVVDRGISVGTALLTRRQVHLESTSQYCVTPTQVVTL